MKVELSKNIANRFSPRSFSSQLLKEEEIQSLFEAARLAPSSYNEQPWRFIYGTKDDNDSFEKVVNCVNEVNQKWATDAPLIIIVLAKKEFSKDNQVNRHAWHDVGFAVANITQQATDLGLFVHQMGGILHDKIKDDFQINADYEPVSILAIGHMGPNADPKKRTPRKELKEIAFKGVWNN